LIHLAATISRLRNKPPKHWTENLENLLIGMLSEDKLFIRKFAYNKVIGARRNGLTNTLRQFIPPILNFNANNYTELIDWNQINVTEPPMIKHISDKDLKILIIQNSFKQNVQMYPCHVCGHKPQKGV
jgi:hypothetical protein